MFYKISSIIPAKPQTWLNRKFLTFDVDWAHDEILSHTLDILEAADVAATIFVTHNTKLLDRMRENPKIEIGIHPNFNVCFDPNYRGLKSPRAIIEKLLEIVPEAKSVRSHSMLQSSPILDLFAEYGLTHECNHFIPEQSGIELSPWIVWNGLCKVPYFWEDDVHCLYSQKSDMSNLLLRNGLKVFDFHPIHIFLNTEDLDLYESTRKIHYEPSSLWLKRNSNNGTERRLFEIISA